MTVAELIALLQERPPEQEVLVAHHGDALGSEPRVALNYACRFAESPPNTWELDMPSWAMPVTVIYALES